MGDGDNDDGPAPQSQSQISPHTSSNSRGGTLGWVPQSRQDPVVQEVPSFGTSTAPSRPIRDRRPPDAFRPELNKSDTERRREQQTQEGEGPLAEAFQATCTTMLEDTQDSTLDEVAFSTMAAKVVAGKQYSHYGFEPSTYREAIESQENDKWCSAMDKEMSAMKRLGVFCYLLLSSIPTNAKCI